jgi:uncharacterized LabA/DUF88 family protein
MIDGGFYQKRAQALWGDKSAKDRAYELIRYCNKHIEIVDGKEARSLYRIFYYDCPPVSKKVYHPLKKATIDFSKTGLFIWMNEFHNELRSKRKVALRFGRIQDDFANYVLKPDVVKKLCNGVLAATELQEKDFTLTIKQKGVDMRVGLDIASVCFKRQVNQIVLISGDSDFVPAAKLARREGIDFLLDPMHAGINDELFEHIDGLWSPKLYPGSNTCEGGI